MGKKMGIDQFAELSSAVARQLPRDLDPEVVQFWISGDQGALHTALAQALRDRPVPVDPDAWIDELDLTTVKKREFAVTIDPTQTIEQMRDDGEYDYANEHHTTDVFGSCRAVTGTKQVESKVVALSIGRQATISQAKKVRDRLGLHSIGIDHELSVGVHHKNAQRELNWMVNMDSVVLVDGHRCVSYLLGLAGHRRLDLRGAGRVWHGDAWFLGLLSE